MSEKKGGSMPVVASPVEDALKDLRRGQMVILVDDAEDQGEADLCLATVVVSWHALVCRRGRSIWCVWPDSSQRRPSVRSCVMTGPWPREKTSKNSLGSTPSRWSACRT